MCHDPHLYDPTSIPITTTLTISYQTYHNSPIPQPDIYPTSYHLCHILPTCHFYLTYLRPLYMPWSPLTTTHHPSPLQPPWQAHIRHIITHLFHNLSSILHPTTYATSYHPFLFTSPISDPYTWHNRHLEQPTIHPYCNHLIMIQWFPQFLTIHNSPTASRTTSQTSMLV
jgi:hypothetical protein